MLKYLARRVVFIFASLLVISIVLFAIFQFMPGDPVLRMMGDRMGDMSPEEWEIEVEAVRQLMGLDGPIVWQYIRWIINMASGDWGISIVQRRPVLEAIRVPIAWSVVLNVSATIIVFFITVPLGILCAVKRGKLFDNGTLVFTMLGFSMPNFLVAVLLIVIFAVTLQWFPIAGMISPIPPDTSWLRFVDRLRHMALPLITITFVGLAGVTRQVRAAMCDALTEDYVRTARSKGLKEKVVVFSHAFRNVLIPLVTTMTGSLITMFSGNLVIETLFVWSGMGRVMIDSIFRADYAVVMAMSVFYALVALIAIFIMDIVYGLVDPRVKVMR